MTKAGSQRADGGKQNGGGGKLRRSDLSVAPRPKELPSPVGAAYSGPLSEDAAPGRSLRKFWIRQFYKVVGLHGPLRPSVSRWPDRHINPLTGPIPAYTGQKKKSPLDSGCEGTAPLPISPVPRPGYLHLLTAIYAYLRPPPLHPCFLLLLVLDFAGHFHPLLAKTKPIGRVS
jgi:hypothetical protein